MNKDASVDFPSVVRLIASKGAFRDFVKPLGDPDVLIAGEYKYPRYPGEKSYGNGPMVLQRHEQDLPQGLIDAQRKSFTSAINLFMPNEQFGIWMHEFFSGDFLGSKAFRGLIRKVNFPVERTGFFSSSLDDRYSMDLDNPNRKRSDRKLYTNREIGITQKVCKAQPGIAVTVIAYQAAFIEYLDKLHGAIGAATDLPPEEKMRGLEVVADLKRNWETDNFMDNLLPGIAISYYRNHNGDLSQAPTEKDFTDGMRFAFGNGMFNNKVRGPEGDTKDFSCPARGIIVRSAGIDVTRSPDADDSNAVIGGLGTGLHHIYRVVDRQLGSDSHTANQTIEEVRTMIAKAVGEGQGAASRFSGSSFG